MIISGDHDFKQLQSYMNVRQYDPVRKKAIEVNDPERYLKEHTMKGDRGDGVPNYLSPGNSFVLNIRQKPIMQKKLDIWVNQKPEEFCDETQLARYYENKKLVDLSEIPDEVVAAIMAEFAAQKNKKRVDLFGYFISHKLKNLMADIADFSPSKDTVD